MVYSTVVEKVKHGKDSLHLELCRLDNWAAVTPKAERIIEIESD